MQRVKKQEKKNVLQYSQNRNFNLYNSMTTGQTPSAEEDHVIWSKVPGQLLNGPSGEIRCGQHNKGFESKQNHNK